MHISDLIRKLQHIRSRDGDLLIVFSLGDVEGYNEATDVKMLTLTPNPHPDSWTGEWFDAENVFDDEIALNKLELAVCLHDW